MGAVSAQRPMLDDAAFRRWVKLSLDSLGQLRAEIDALNVFPVPDGDTGTNMFLTFEQAAAAVDDCAPGHLAASAAALARGALLGARGNSGVILSQLLRGMSEVLAEATSDGATAVGADVIAAGFRHASTLADAAVDRPVEGTILSVARATAEGAESVVDGDLAEVVSAAADASRIALARTPEQLEQLRRAGVVDAGGRGYVALVDAMIQTLTGRRPPVTQTRVQTTGEECLGDHQGALTSYAGPAFELIFMLEADESKVDGLRTRLHDLGDSLVIVGGEPLWSVHVHVDDAGAAVEAAIDAGKPSRIRISNLVPAVGVAVDEGQGSRALVVVAHGPGIEEVLVDAGATVVMAQPRQRPSTAELLDGIHRSAAGEVIVLPSDKDTLAVAEAAAAEARSAGIRVSVIPSRSVVQSLAAVAVHDQHKLFGDDVVAMTRAAGATHYGAVTIAARDGMTSAGICRVGDVLGLVDGDIAVIGNDIAAVSNDVIDMLAAPTSELMTIVEGSQCTEAVRQEVSAHIASEHRMIDVVRYSGGQPFWPLIIGVE